MRSRTARHQAVRFLCWLLAAVPCTLLALLLLCFGVPAFKPYLYPSPDIAWIRDLYRHKDAALAPVPGPRLLLVGGSAVHFGFDADRITAALGIETFNYGAHGGLDLTYLLDRAERAARPGDTVLLAIEYPLFRTAAPFTALPVFYSSFHDKRFWQRMPAGLWLDYASQYDPRLVLRAAADNLTHWKRAPLSERGGGYRVATVDARGSERGASEAGATQRMRQQVAQDRQVIRPLDRHSPGSRAVAGFVQRQQERGVAVLAGWPPSQRRPEYCEPAAHRLFAELRAFWGDLGVAVVGAPEQFMVPDEAVYDTSFHMNDRGQAMVTAALIDALRARPVQAVRNAP
ncbi:hypothetical protein [Geminicoccus harenae]|uniref:hypothetical protein n=2 Tax=Geminicoccus harenae TaxID=2498453 RepID=UPI001C98387D|nr:hypothetical protein [Geminicoccus harenae]